MDQTYNFPPRNLVISSKNGTSSSIKFCFAGILRPFGQLSDFSWLFYRSAWSQSYCTRKFSLCKPSMSAFSKIRTVLDAPSRATIIFPLTKRRVILDYLSCRKNQARNIRVVFNKIMMTFPYSFQIVQLGKFIKKLILSYYVKYSHTIPLGNV